MARTITIDPVTRIEGHAKISIHLDDAGEVSDARFHVVEYRGFEKFCEGRPFTEMAGITARICGICPVSHLLASAKTGDKILAVKIPPRRRQTAADDEFGSAHTVPRPLLFPPQQPRFPVGLG